MNNFLNEFLYFSEQYVKNNYPGTTIHNIDIDKVKDFNYEENESPLHNGVIYLNKKLLNSINKNSSLLEIGCVVNSIFIDSKKINFLG